MLTTRQLLCLLSLAYLPALAAQGHGRENYENHQGNWDYDHYCHPYHDWYWHGDGHDYPGYYTDPNVYFYGGPSIDFKYSAVPSGNTIDFRNPREGSWSDTED